MTDPTEAMRAAKPEDCVDYGDNRGNLIREQIIEAEKVCIDLMFSKSRFQSMERLEQYVRYRLQAAVASQPKVSEVRKLARILLIGLSGLCPIAQDDLLKKERMLGALEQFVAADREGA